MQIPNSIGDQDVLSDYDDDDENDNDSEYKKKVSGIFTKSTYLCDELLFCKIEKRCSPCKV